jgi:MalT-like TPR region
MRLDVMLGYTLMYTGDPGSVAAFNRAIDIADRLGDTAALCEALFGLAYQYVLAGDYPSAVRTSERAFLHVDGSCAEAAVTSDNLLALTHHLSGNQATAYRHAERALSRGIDSGRPVGGRPHWLDHRVRTRAVLCRILWVRGFPDQAANAAHDCVEDALSVGHWLSVNFALIYACTVVLWIGDMPAAERFVGVALDHTARYSLRRWHFYARSLATVLQFRRGKIRRKIARRDGMLSDPLCDRMSLETLGTLSEDLVSGEAVARAETGRAEWCAAEILRANAAVMLKEGALDAAAAETQFRRSLDLARGQGALSWELRAATSLARLWQDQGRAGEAHDLLASVYGRFAEGFRTADLVAARGLLNELAS